MLVFIEEILYRDYSLIIHVIDIKATLIRKIALYPLSPNDQLRERC